VSVPAGARVLEEPEKVLSSGFNLRETCARMLHDIAAVNSLLDITVIADNVASPSY
jgi:hypothetical protein